MIADWTVPFFLTSALYTSTPLPINQLIPDVGYFYLRQDGCALRNTVRAQRNPIPQAEGEILHRRFLEGMEMDLAIQLWQSTSQMACETLQQQMLDELMGYLYNLINAGDNQGRISWTPNRTDLANPARMLDDVRLLTYPSVSSLPNSLGIEIAVTLDCALPYEEDLLPTIVTLSGDDLVTNRGNRPVYPVFRIYSGSFTLSNATTGYYFVFNSALPGCPEVGGGDYVEINCLRNTAYLNGNDKNMKAGIQMRSSDFFMLVPGANNITIDSGTGTSEIEFNSAWA